MGKIFISYRRDDAGDAAGRLKDNLLERFGADSIFIDVDGIAPGRDFRKAINEALGQSVVLLAVMGKNWLQSTDEKGRRRLDQPGDFVRLEIGTALKRDIPVIPVCVQGAAVPNTDDLPDDLKDFAFRNSFGLTHARWSSDFQLLAEKLRPYMGDLGRQQTVAAPVSGPLERGSFKIIVKWSLAVVLVLAISIGIKFWPKNNGGGGPSSGGNPAQQSSANAKVSTPSGGTPNSANNTSVAPDKTKAEPVSCLDGEWREADASQIVWRFEVEGQTLKIKRLDSFVSGVFSKSGDDWHGSLQWGNGDKWENVILSPTRSCDHVFTNQAWSYKR